MPLLNDRVKETTTTTGTGTLTLLGASSQFQSFATAFPNNPVTVYYCVAGQTTSDWEVGIGTFTGPSTLTRDQVISSSNANALVNLAAGTKDVFCTIASFHAMSLGTWLALNSGTYFL